MAQKRPYLIALLTPVGMGMHGQVMSGVMASAPVRSDDFRIYHFFTRGTHEEAIRKALDQAFEYSFDGIITIGASAARVTKQVFQEKGITIPHVFVGVNDPITARLCGNLSELVAHNMTGVLYDALQNDKAAQFLCEAKPHAKSILIVSEGMSSQSHGSPAHWLEAEVDLIRSVCRPHGIQVISRYAPTLSDLYLDIYKCLDQFDTLVLLEGGISLNLYEALGYLCNENKKTLFSGLIEPVTKSAALGFGSSYESMGEHAAAYMYKMLIENVRIDALPLYKDSKGREAAVNLELAEKQDLDPEHIEKVCRRWNGIVFKTIAL